MGGSAFPRALPDGTSWWRVVAVLALVGCGRTELVIGPAASEDGGAGLASSSGASGGMAGRGGGTEVGGAPPAVGGGGASPGVGGGGGQVEPPIVGYGHTKDALFAIDASVQPVPIGPLEGCDGEATDIAMNAAGDLYVVSLDALFTVSKDTAQCTPIASHPGAMPNSLAFLPPGAGSTDERLVGYQADRYLRLDPSTGDVTLIGSLGVAGWVSSGDLIWYWDRLFLSVTGPGCDDCLIEVDPELGFFKANVGDLGAMSIFGLASWADALFGFTGEGLIVVIDPNSATATLVTEAPMPWLGATSTPASAP